MQNKIKKLSSFWGCGIQPNKCWELNSTALNQAAVNSWPNVGREHDSLTKHKSPSYPCTKCVRGMRIRKGSHCRRNWQQWDHPGLNTSRGGWLDIVSSTEWMPGQKTDGILLSSTDSLIKDLEDDNRLDRGLCVCPPSDSSSREGQATVSQSSFK